MELDVNKVLNNYKQKLADISERMILLEVENEQLKQIIQELQESKDK